MAKRLPKTTHVQYEELLQFIKNNRIILSGKTKPLEGKKINILWEQFAAEINSKGCGPLKTAEQWRNIWNEWKTNTKRKSRAIQQSLIGTGGGPPTSKALTDLERQLLELISFIHLGDPDVMDTLTIKKSSEEPISVLGIYENVTPIANQVDEDLVTLHETETPKKNVENINGLEPLQHENQPVIDTILETPRKKKKINTQDTRYSNSILSNACESYAEAQKNTLESKKLEASGLIQISKALEKNAAALEEKNRIELMKLKLEYLKHFTNLDNFSELEN